MLNSELNQPKSYVKRKQYAGNKFQRQAVKGMVTGKPCNLKQ